MSAHEVLQELLRVVRADVLYYMRIGPHGDPVLDWSRLTRDQAAALVEVTVEDFLDGRGEDAREVGRVRFKLASKIDALELLGKHHKLDTDRVEHQYGGASLADRLAAALARVRGETPQEVRRSSRRTERHRRSQVGTRTGRHQTLPERCRKLSVQRQGSRERVSAD
jgi:hypothetical protein